MDLTFSQDEQSFREEVRRFVAERLPADVKRKVENGLRLQKDDYLRWQKTLYEQGWAAPGWPVERGGPGWTSAQRYIFEQECALGSAPAVISFGLNMVGPVIIEFGNAAQKARFLPRILASEDWWCQSYSEPGAGSDLASLKMRAIRNGDHYVVNGAKTWTTLAQYADMIFCLVRTSSTGKKQEGISFLLIDMHSPGVTVRPIVTFDGGQEINEVFFEDVKVPAENLVGEEGKGWTYAKFLLGHERVGIAQVARSKRNVARLKKIAGAEFKNGKALVDDPMFRAKISTVEIDLLALEHTELRILSDESAGRAPGPESSLLKIRGTEIQQEITELLVEAVGYYASPYQPALLREGANEEPVGPDHAPALAPTYFNWRKTSIYGGSNEIQKNIIAKAILGL